MFKANLLKAKRQPLLLGVLVMLVCYSSYFIFKARSQPSAEVYWFKNFVVYLNCLQPFFFNLIVAVQRRFEDQSSNFNRILALPSRSKWLINFTAQTYLIWILNLVIMNFLFVCFTSLAMKTYLMFWLSLAILGSVWLPIIDFISIIYGYVAGFVIGIIAIPFTIYYGTEQLGTSIWRIIPWVYNAKIYLISSQRLVWFILIIAVVTLIKQLLANWRFNNWLGN